MKNHAVFFVSIFTLLTISSSSYGHQDLVGADTANDIKEIEKPDASEATSASSKPQKPGESVTANVGPTLQKPSEAEAVEAAIAYLNRDGKMTIKKSEFVAWGTYSEKRLYWPMKLRLTYKISGSDVQRQNEYAVKISRDINGKLQANTYYAWRTDFK